MVTFTEEIFNEKLHFLCSVSSKIGDNESLPNYISVILFLTNNHKSKTDFNGSRSSSSKSSLKSSSNFLTSFFAHGIYLPFIEKLKKIEHAKLLALQAEEHSKRIVKLLEKMIELGRESILFEAAETRDETALAELET